MSSEVIDMAWQLTFDANGGARLNTADEDIRQSLRLLISTRRGERLMRPEYGCDLAQFAFESVDSSLISRMRGEILRSISAYEPRVDDVTVDIAPGGSAGALIVNIGYVVRENGHEQELAIELDGGF